MTPDKAGVRKLYGCMREAFPDGAMVAAQTKRLKNFKGT
jgi:hypothetical protein